MRRIKSLNGTAIAPVLPLSRAQSMEAKYHKRRGSVGNTLVLVMAASALMAVLYLGRHHLPIPGLHKAVDHHDEWHSKWGHHDHHEEHHYDTAHHPTRQHYTGHHEDVHSPSWHGDAGHGDTHHDTHHWDSHHQEQPQHHDSHWDSSHYQDPHHVDPHHAADSHGHWDSHDPHHVDPHHAAADSHGHWDNHHAVDQQHHDAAGHAGDANHWDAHNTEQQHHDAHTQHQPQQQEHGRQVLSRGKWQQNSVVNSGRAAFKGRQAEEHAWPQDDHHDSHVDPHQAAGHADPHQDQHAWQDPHHGAHAAEAHHEEVHHDAAHHPDPHQQEVHEDAHHWDPHAPHPDAHLDAHGHLVDDHYHHVDHPVEHHGEHHPEVDEAVPDPAEDATHHYKKHAPVHVHDEGHHDAHSGIFALEAMDIHGHMRKLSDFAGKVLLIVNVASHCGFTDSNYKGLMEVYKKYQRFGLEVLAFPCNQFGHQEPGSDRDIFDYALNHYQVTFPMFSKVEVNGPNMHPVYRFLRTHLPEQYGGGAGKGVGHDLGWNFQKILVNRDGWPVKLRTQDWNQATVENDVYELITGHPAPLE